MRARIVAAAGALGLGGLLLYQLGPVLAMRPYTPKLQAGQATVKLTVRTSPRVKARVFWGRRFLGETPLDLKWPRDSGPLDLIVEAKGYLLVHSRLYTFNDDRLSVQLTAEAEKKSLFGYRRELPDGGPPPGGASPDGGAPRTSPIAPGAQGLLPAPGAQGMMPAPGVMPAPGAPRTPAVAPGAPAPAPPGAAPPPPR